MAENNNGASVSDTSNNEDTQATTAKVETETAHIKSFPSGAIELVSLFDGITKVNDFIDNLESVAKLMNLNQPQCKALAILKLRGKAKEFLDTHLRIKTEGTWDDLKTGLKKRFEKQKLPGQVEHEFQNCKQRVGESIRDFSERVRKLGLLTVTYTDDPQHNIFTTNALTRDFLRIFKTGLLGVVRQRVMSKNPKEFEEAIEIAEQEEIIETFTKNVVVDEVNAAEANGNSSKGKQKVSRNNENEKKTEKKVNYAAHYTHHQNRFQGNTIRRGNPTNYPANQQQNFQKNFQPNFQRNFQLNQYGAAQFKTPYKSYQNNINPSFKPRNQEYRHYTYQRNQKQGKYPIQCYRCNNIGHLANSCRSNLQTNCFKCGRVGHLAKFCRSTLVTTQQETKELNGKKVASEIRDATKKQ